MYGVNDTTFLSSVKVRTILENNIYHYLQKQCKSTEYNLNDFAFKTMSSCSPPLVKQVYASRHWHACHYVKDNIQSNNIVMNDLKKGKESTPRAKEE